MQAQVQTGLKDKGKRTEKWKLSGTAKEVKMKWEQMRGVEPLKIEKKK